MTDLRAILGAKYDDTIEKATRALYLDVSASFGDPTDWDEFEDRNSESAAAYRHDAAVVLAAVLPDLLADAWDEGQRATLDKVTRFYGLQPHEALFLMNKAPNPYRKEAP